MRVSGRLVLRVKIQISNFCLQLRKSVLHGGPHAAVLHFVIDSRSAS